MTKIGKLKTIHYSKEKANERAHFLRLHGYKASVRMLMNGRYRVHGYRK